MSTHRHVILFQSRFADLVERGEKSQTIRPERKRLIRVGDTLDLRAWSGLPYRSKQRGLREAACTVLKWCEISRQGLIYLNGELAPKGFAKADGFRSHTEMVNWFDSMHGLPFSGVLIEWV